MSEDSSNDNHEKITASVASWWVWCPDCENFSECDLDQQPNGIDYLPDPSKRFINCDHCGYLIEVCGVRITPLDEIAL